MPAVYLDTIEDVRAYLAALEPVYITSKTHGRIPVPCVRTVLVRVELVVENLYNPNEMSPDKMDALQTSMLENGVCFPVATIWDEEAQRFVIVDGAHRRRILGPDWLDCDYVPLVPLPHDMSKRLAATWQFNKARGVHQVDMDAELIRRMVEQGMSDEDVAAKLGTDVDTVYRYKQVTGVAELFRNADYSMSWTMVDDEASG